MSRMKLLTNNELVIGVIGLGYVGLPLAVGFAASGLRVIGFDINERKLKQLEGGYDPTKTVKRTQLDNLTYTSNAAALKQCDVLIIAVPTDIDDAKQPHLGPLLNAARQCAANLKEGATVVVESTVYPGATEEEVVPILQEAEVDFTYGYSPERVAPGSGKERTVLNGSDHCLANTNKLVGACNSMTCVFLMTLYRRVVTEAKVVQCPTVKVAEAAKCLENIQRDMNISLINEVALIFDRLGIDTHDVLEAAGTKFNFHPYTPGLVGGHCIPVDPYYMAARAKKAGFHANVILSGRQINDRMGVFVARKTIKLLAGRFQKPRIVVAGYAFKSNCSDFRNTRVKEIVQELESYGAVVQVVDPELGPGELEYASNDLGSTVNATFSSECHGIIVATLHDSVRAQIPHWVTGLHKDGVFVTVPKMERPMGLPKEAVFWRL